MPEPRPQAVPLDLIQAPSPAAIPWLRHAFTARAGGVSTPYGQLSLNLGFTPHDDLASVHENRRRLVTAITPEEPWPIVTARQTHSATIRAITELPLTPIEADALATSLPGILLAILTADCVPILLVDTRLRVVAAVHAGWRGTAARILEQTVQHLRDHHHSRPEDLYAAIGPSIGSCCYQVGEEVRIAFRDPTLFQDDRLDLWQANRLQLLASGLSPKNIETFAQCTACARTPAGEPRFFSHRAEQGRTGRMMSLIGIE